MWRKMGGGSDRERQGIPPLASHTKERPNQCDKDASVGKEGTLVRSSDSELGSDSCRVPG